MKTIGQLLIFAAVLTSISAISMAMSSPNILDRVGAIALPAACLIVGTWLLRRSKSKH